MKQFLWYSVEMFESEAWRGLSINARRTLDRLCLEHVAHGGSENGRLVVTHDDFIDFGVTACRVRDALCELVAFGFISMKQGGRWAGSNHPNSFTLTWLGWWDAEGEMRDPTNRWKGVTAEKVAAFKAERSALNAAKRRRRARKAA